MNTNLYIFENYLINNYILKFQNLNKLEEFYKFNAYCIVDIIKSKFNNGIECPYCDSKKYYIMGRGGYKCKYCRLKYTLKNNTIFKDSKLSFRQWFTAIYLTKKENISSIGLSKIIGISQKSAWKMQCKINNVFKEHNIVSDIENAIIELHISEKDSSEYNSLFLFFYMIYAGESSYVKSSIAIGIKISEAKNIKNNWIKAKIFSKREKRFYLESEVDIEDTNFIIEAILIALCGVGKLVRYEYEP